MAWEASRVLEFVVYATKRRNFVKYVKGFQYRRKNAA